MSQTDTSPRAGGPRLEVVAIAAICVIALLGLWYVLSQRQQSLRSSAAGLDGLQVWLTANGVNSYNFAGGWPIDETSVDLLILPIYDTALGIARERPTTKEALLEQQDEYDLDPVQIRLKAHKVPTLLVLPKWRSGMRLTGRAHPVLLLEAKRVEQTLAALTRGTPELTQSASPFTPFRFKDPQGRNLTAEIYSPQTFKNADCTPLIGSPSAMILADCPLKIGKDEQEDGGRNRVLILSDPDLINNHGLRLGDNARIALGFLSERKDEGNIVIDYSRSSWLRDPRSEPERERTWSDLARFFAPPFLILWLGAGLLLILFMWRAALRYGPVLRERTGQGASKALAVAARARLMRLTGQDGALVRDYVAARIAAAAAAHFGPAHARHYSRQDTFLGYAERQYPAEAPRLRAVLDQVRDLPARISPADAIHLIDEFEQVLEQITHDA